MTQQIRLVPCPHHFLLWPSGRRQPCSRPKRRRPVYGELLLWAPGEQSREAGDVPALGHDAHPTHIHSGPQHILQVKLAKVEREKQ